jgi:hypothetical protein
MDKLDYVAQKDCGCVVAWCSSNIPRRDLAKETGDWLRRGFSVVRMTTEESRKTLKECKCGVPEIPKPPKQEVLF